MERSLHSTVNIFFCQKLPENSNRKGHTHERIYATKGINLINTGKQVSHVNAYDSALIIVAERIE